MKGKAFCCRCCLCCYKESDLKKPTWACQIQDLAKWHNVKEDDIINHVRKSNNESNENTELLTLKAMTVLFVIATIVSLYFFALYTSDELTTFQAMLTTSQIMLRQLHISTDQMFTINLLKWLMRL